MSKTIKIFKTNYLFRYKKTEIVLLVVMMLIIMTYTILDINITTDTDISTVSSVRQEVLSQENIAQLPVLKATELSIKDSNYPKKEPLKLNVTALLFASALSPGITLLRVAYLVNGHGANLEQWLSVFWILAFIDFFGDKIPGGIAIVYQFIQYPLVFFSAYLIASNSGNGSIIFTLLVSLALTAVQVIRQLSSAFLDGISLGCGSTVRSFLEDIIALIIIFNV